MEPCRITELSNEITRHIDTADPLGIVRQLCQSDAQLFAGWGGHASVNDATTLRKLSKLSRRATALLKEKKELHKKNVFVFSGCGTSGRMAWLCSRAYNRILGRFGHSPCFHYLIAGGDESLINSNELPEDDPPQGAEDLRKMSEDANHVMFFGISCGLSAPYVAGQIDYAMHQPNMTAVLMGFNPVSLSRNAPVEKWSKTCREVFLELEAISLSSDRAVILNPIVGPEAITGSSRMKGGSMTAILLDTVFLSALETLLEHPATSSTAKTTTQQQQQQTEQQLGFDHALSPDLTSLTKLLDCYTLTYQAVYRNAEGMAALMRLAVSCLRHPSGRLVYLGADALGAIGLIDASEMVDTYGADEGEVRGFVVGGWDACMNTEGDLSWRGNLFRISLSHFETSVLPSLTSHDCVLCIHGNTRDPHLHSIMNRVLSSSARCGLLLVVADEDSVSTNYHQYLDSRYVTTALLQIPYYYAFDEEPVFAGFGLKLVLNAVSTGANIMKGRVHGNTMINLTLSNDKLFYRAIDIVQKLSGVDHKTATTALLRAIHRDHDITKFQDDPVSSHIGVATTRNMVVPLALVLARGQSSSVAEAELLLQSAANLSGLISSDNPTVDHCRPLHAIMDHSTPL